MLDAKDAGGSDEALYLWCSQAAFRVRIALDLKGLTREDITVNLDRCDQFKPEYKAQNPQAVVPTLYDGNAKLFQSVAMLES
jgi:glutathione S-transferase